MSWLRTGVLLGCLLSSWAARADAGGETNPLAMLFPSAPARARQEADRAAAALARTLERLPDVLRVHVQLTPQGIAPQPLDQPRPPARMSVVLELSGPGPSDDQLQRLARVASPEPLEQPITIVRSSTARARTAHEIATVRVGPFEVLASSATRLRAVLAACLLANVSLATILLVRRGHRGPRNQQN